MNFAEKSKDEHEQQAKDKARPEEAEERGFDINTLPKMGH
jgi:hypothetical protein